MMFYWLIYQVNYTFTSGYFTLIWYKLRRKEVRVLSPVEHTVSGLLVWCHENEFFPFLFFPYIVDCVQKVRHDPVITFCVWP